MRISAGSPTTLRPHPGQDAGPGRATVGRSGIHGAIARIRGGYQKVLGVSVGERSMAIAEVAVVRGNVRVTRSTEWPYPDGLGLSQPEALGAALGDFLRHGGFAARSAVFGLPAKWLKVKATEAPPSDPQTAAEVLALQAEAESDPELGEMVYDFAGETSPTEPSTVLLMGVPRRRVQGVLAVAEAARLRAVSVTPCATALGEATAAGVNGSLLLWVRPDGAELSERHGRRVRFVRHLGSATGAQLVAELRRAAAAAAARDEHDAGLLGHGGNGSPRRVVLWDNVGLEPSVLRGIESALGMPVSVGELAALNGIGCGAGASAVAVALPLVEGRTPGVDFLHSRLVVRRRRMSRRAPWIAAGIAAVVVAGLVGYADLALVQRDVNRMDAKLDAMKPALKTAMPFVASMQFAETFRAHDPRFLSCLRDLTLELPPDGRTYLTNFHLQATMKGEFSGRSSGDQEVVALMDKLSSGGRFKDLKRRLDARGKGPEVSFAVTFTYVPKK